MADTTFPLQPQDNMEISNDSVENDVDFDIDFDAHVIYPDEDEMKDDLNPQDIDADIELRSVTPGDQYMADEPSSIDRIVEEDGIMADEPAIDQDEELLDLSDDEETVQAVQMEPYETQADAQPDNSNTPSTTGSMFLGHEIPSTTLPFNDPGTPNVKTEAAAIDQLQRSDHEAQHNKDDMPERPEGLALQHSTPEISNVNEQVAYATPNAGALEAAGGGESDTHSEAEPNTKVNKPENDADDDTQHKPIIGEDVPNHEHAQPNTDVTSQHDESASPRSHTSDTHQTVTGLHPTIVKYDGGEYLLFPPGEASAGDVYFLQDENLVNGSINDLLKACRATLNTAITLHEELELYVEELDLYVCEDSTAAFSTSFAELLDLYVQLHKCDGNDSPGPLSVALYGRSRFASRLSYLMETLSNGRGLSSLTEAREDHVDDDGSDDEATAADQPNASLTDKIVSESFATTATPEADDHTVGDDDEGNTAHDDNDTLPNLAHQASSRAGPLEHTTTNGDDVNELPTGGADKQEPAGDDKGRGSPKSGADTTKIATGSDSIAAHDVGANRYGAEPHIGQPPLHGPAQDLSLAPSDARGEQTGQESKHQSTIGEPVAQPKVDEHELHSATDDELEEFDIEEFDETHGESDYHVIDQTRANAASTATKRKFEAVEEFDDAKRPRSSHEPA